MAGVSGHAMLGSVYKSCHLVLVGWIKSGPGLGIVLFVPESVSVQRFAEKQKKVV